MAIKNFQQLSTSSLRKQALSIAEAGFAAMDAKNIIGKNLAYNPKKQKLTIKNQEFDLAKFKRIFCLPLGQGSKEVSENIKLILKDKTFLDVDLSENNSIPEIFKDDLVICVIFDYSNKHESSVLSALRASGADDSEISMVSKRLEKFQGGQLAKSIYPATGLSLIFSGKSNDISLIANGPTIKDEATNTEASEILKKYNILQQLNINSLKLQETPKEDKYFKNIHNILMLFPEIFLQAAREKAEDLGFAVRVLSGNDKSFPDMAASIKKGQCLLSAGGSAEMALNILPGLKGNEVLVCLLEGAGFIADGLTLARAKALALNLDDGASNFFESLGQQIEVEAEFGLGNFILCVG